MLKKSLLIGAALMLMIGGAPAADIIEPAAYDWTGPYIGLQGGYGWGENDVSIDQVSLPAVARLPSLNPPSDGSIDADGFVGGLHAGYNFQSDSLVFGLEGDAEYSGMRGDTDILFSPTDEVPVANLRKDIDWLASLRLRVGLAMDRALVYATGGLAVGGIDLNVAGRGEAQNEPPTSESDTAWGWTIGAGLEYAFTEALSARIEYRYTDLENTEVDVLSFATADVDNTFHAVRAGLSWHFGGL